MSGTVKDPTLFFLFGSVRLLLLGSLSYGIYTTIGPSSHKLRNTIQYHRRMHELGVAHLHNSHNLNKAEHIQ